MVLIARFSCSLPDSRVKAKLDKSCSHDGCQWKYLSQPVTAYHSVSQHVTAYHSISRHAVPPESQPLGQDLRRPLPAARSMALQLPLGSPSKPCLQARMHELRGKAQSTGQVCSVSAQSLLSLCSVSAGSMQSRCSQLTDAMNKVLDVREQVHHVICVRQC